MPAREPRDVERESANPNQQLLDKFVEWKRTEFDPYAKSFEDAQSRLSWEDEKKLDPAFIDKWKKAKEAHDRLARRAMTFGATLESTREQADLSVQNTLEVSDVKNELANLRRDFDPIKELKDAIAKRGEPREVGNPNEALQKDFNSWKLEFDKLAGKVSGVTERAEEVVFELGRDPAGLRDLIKGLQKEVATLSTQVVNLDTAIQSSLQETVLNARNAQEFGFLKSELTRLENNLTTIEQVIGKAEISPQKEEAQLTKPEDADAIVNKYALIAAAVGLVPIPFLDVVGIGALQAKMLDELYKLYFPDEPAATAGFSKNFSQNLLTIVLTGLGTGLVGGAIGSAFKFIPVVGWLPGAGAVSVLGGTATFVVGKLVKEELDKGLSPTQVMDTLKTVEKSKVTELRKAAARVLRA